MLLSGYQCAPSEADYWPNNIDLHVDLVSSTMSRHLFQTIKRYINLADNHNLYAVSDKAPKVTPLLFT